MTDLQGLFVRTEVVKQLVPISILIVSELRHLERVISTLNKTLILFIKKIKLNAVLLEKEKCSETNHCVGT